MTNENVEMSSAPAHGTRELPRMVFVTWCLDVSACSLCGSGARLLTSGFVAIDAFVRADQNQVRVVSAERDRTQLERLQTSAQ